MNRSDLFGNLDINSQLIPENIEEHQEKIQANQEPSKSNLVGNRILPTAPIVQPFKTLADDLGNIADDLRSLHAEFGTRPYRLFSVVYKEENGNSILISETEFYPRPLINFNLTEELMSGGKETAGTIRVSELSTKYTEYDLRAIFPRFLEENEHSFLEIQADNQPRYRLVINNIPIKNTERAEWTFTATTEDSPRDVFGNFKNPKLYGV